jgi:tetratricopeptide (TPR) repeat protein
MAPLAISNDGIKADGLIARVVDWVFGYDFFLSYSHGDGMRLPRRLKERLEKAGFRVFLDQTEYVAGADLRRETRRQVVKSRKIVIIARAGALKSEWVKREVDVALAHGKIPVILNLNGAVESAPQDATLATMARERHWLRLTETLADPDGEPSDWTISELVRGFNHTRQETKRQRIFATAAAVLALMASVATWQAIEAIRARTVAEAQRDRAERVLQQVIGNANRRVEALSLRMKRDRETPRQPIPIRALHAPEPASRSPLQQANDLITQATTFLASADVRGARSPLEEALRILEISQSAEPQWQLALFNLYNGLAKSASLLEQLAGSGTPGPDVQRDLSVGYQQIADALLAAGRAEEALVWADKDLAISQRAAADSPSQQRDLGSSYDRRARALAQLGRNAEALNVYDQGATLVEAAAAADNAEPSWQRDAAAILENKGKLLEKMGQQEPPLHLFRRALSLRERIAALEPQWQAEVEDAYWRITRFMRSIGRDQEALETAEQYLLATSFAADADSGKAERIGRALGTLSWSAILAGKFPRAEWAGRHAVDLAPKLDWVRSNYAHALMLSGQREKAKEIYLGTGSLSPETAKKWKGQVLNDFEEMKRRRIGDSLMVEISAEFKRLN